MIKDTRESLLQKNVGVHKKLNFALQVEVTPKGDFQLNNDDFPHPQDEQLQVYQKQLEKQFTIPEIMEKASALEQHLVQEFPFDSNKSRAQIGRDSNLVYASEDLSLIQFWSLNGRKDVNKITIQQKVNEIQTTDYFIIAQVTLEEVDAYFIYDAFSLKFVGQAKSGNSIMKDAKSTKDLLIISDSNGMINTITINNKSSITQQVFKNEDENVMELYQYISISTDGKMFTVFEQISSSIAVFSVNPLIQIWKKEMPKPEKNEDVSKYIIISNDNLYVALRNMVRKGVDYYSMTDSTIILSIESMHVNPINQILYWNNGKSMISCSKDKKIKIWSLTTCDLEHSFPPQHQGSVESIILSQNQKVLFSGSLDQTVGVWCLQNFQLLAILNATIKIVQLNFTDDQSFLIAKNDDHDKIQYWRLEENSQSIKLAIDTSSLNECIVTPNGEYIVTTNLRTMGMEIWNTITKSCVTKFQYSFGRQRAVNCTHSSSYIFFQREPGEMIRWSTKTQSDSGVYSHSDDIIDIVIDQADQFLYTMGYQKGKFYKWELQSMTQLNIIDLGKGYEGLVISHDDRFIIASDFVQKSLTNIDLKTDEIISVRDNQPYNPATLTITLDSKYVAVCQGHLSSKLIILHLDTLEIYKILEEHKQSNIWFIASTLDGRYVISRNSQETIIWDAQNFHCILFVEEKFILLLSEHRVMRAFLHDGFFKIWSAQTASQLSDDFPSAEENTVGESEDSKMQLRITGPMNSIAPLIIQSMIKAVKSEQKLFVTALKENFIIPYKINILHYFAFFNNPESLTQCLEQGTQYSRDSSGKSPLEYSIERMSQQGTDILLDFIMKRENVYQKMKESELIQLVDFSPSNLLNFFENSVLVEEQNVPPYGTIRGVSCNFILTKGPILQVDDCEFMLDQSANEQKQKPLLFKSLKIQYNLEPGSVSSIQLHQSLQDTAIQGIFTSEAINRILQYKWNLVKNYAYSQTLIYFAFVILIIYHSVFNKNSHSCIIMILAFGGYFLFWEGFQMIMNYRAYVGEIWNLLDIGRVALITWYCFTALKNLSDDRHALDNNNKIVLGGLNILVFLRILPYFRLNQNSRVLIRLIIEVCKDMLSFTLLLILCVLGFAITFNIIESEHGDEQTLSSNLGQYYKLIFGDFDLLQEDASNSSWLVFIVSSSFITLIMMNLLIAIMSDTYDRVMTDIASTDGWELNQMILEQESLMFWKRDKGQPMYLHWVTYTGVEPESLWEGRIAAINHSIQDKQSPLINEIRAISSKIDTLQSHYFTHSRDVYLRFEEHRKKLERIRVINSQPYLSAQKFNE
ncbi:wd-40 repeat protein [Stylonychia lemnae]|uniref:Wd-40 repeat protein n=1 Tax=Stylonychia lemnae TaxID=5949 RepID=A0A077ZW72_STYLE|nr:wd-40 repeat protein [Stylonychia lemnae]|eukprot:CDW74119.1 wd-40 repeat protein [Stylonychia lemnae]